MSQKIFRYPIVARNQTNVAALEMFTRVWEKQVTEWRPIETAPKDGTIIRVGWKLSGDKEMQEWFVMQWGHIQRNGLFPGDVGMWVTPDGAITWNDKAGGPTHWMPLPAPPDGN